MLSPAPDSQKAPYGKMKPAMDATLPDGVTRLAALLSAKSRICGGCIFSADNQGPCSGLTASSTRQGGVARFVADPGIDMNGRSFDNWAKGLSSQQKKVARMLCFTPQQFHI